MSFLKWRLWAVALLAIHSLPAQNAKPGPDVLILSDDEKLVGQVEQSTGTSLKFKSDIVGEVIVDWSKVKELHSSHEFAIIPNGIQLRRDSDLSKIPQGVISAAEQQITVTPTNGAPQTVSAANSNAIVDEAAFQNAVHYNPGLFHDWGGGITIGGSLVQATQVSRTFTGAINLLQTVPDATWLRPRTRTIIDITAAYGTITQPNTPTVKTAIYHGGIERDWYFTNRVYGYLGAAWDHNLAQGLNLQQTYGGGIGWSVIREPNQTLDLKAGVNYIRQAFYPSPTTSSQTLSLIGSNFEEDYMRGLWHGARFTQQLIILPAWNNLDAISALGSATLTIPAYKRMNFTLGVVDNYLNSAPEGFKKNSFQATVGLTYALR